jgi:aspartyl-tRNA synthetase
MTERTQRTLAAELPEKVGERVCLEGWIHAIRKFGAVNFLV